MNRKKNAVISILISIILISNAKSQEGWIQQNSGTNTVLNDIYFINPDTGWVVGDDGKLLKTTDSGEYWFEIPFGYTYDIEAVYFINNNVGWIVMNNDNGDGFILHTDNGGANWSLQQCQDRLIFLHEIQFVNDSTGFIATWDKKIIKTTDRGKTWNGYSKGIGREVCSMWFIDAKTGWVATHGHSVYKTINGGIFWTALPNIYRAWDIFFINSKTGWYVKEGGEDIFRTIDGGDLWDSFDVGFKYTNAHIYFIDENIGYLTSWSRNKGNVYKTTDGGINWSTEDVEINSALNNLYFVNKNIGWIIGNNGLILKKNSGANVNIQESLNIKNIPSTSKLQQNYPNPFNPTTTIKYDLSKPDNIILKIYNLSGQELETLVNGFQTSGEHEITWHPKGLPSGVYIYRLQAGGFTDVREMIFME